MAGTEGRVYGGDIGLIHIKDGTRKAVGELLADELDSEMRSRAIANGSRTYAQAYGKHLYSDLAPQLKQKLCPGCYMIAMFNAVVTLALRNKQSLHELGRTMRNAFERLENCDEDEQSQNACIEEIAIYLDSMGCGL